MGITPDAILLDLPLIGRPADPVYQFDIAGRVFRDAGGDNVPGADIGDLHSPEACHIIHDIAAGAVDRIRSEDS